MQREGVRSNRDGRPYAIVYVARDSGGTDMPPRPLPAHYQDDRYGLAGCVGLLTALVVSVAVWAGIGYVVWRLWP